MMTYRIVYISQAAEEKSRIMGKTENVQISPAPTKPEKNGFMDENRARIHQQMLSPVAHDLKTPLASIIGSLEVYERMKDTLPPDKQATLLHVALHEAYRLDSFVTNILDMAKFDNNLVPIKKEPFDLNSLIKGSLVRLNQRLGNVEVHLIPYESDIEVNSDASLLGRALALVLDNAARYSGNTPAITIRHGADRSRAFISVQDNGPGIPADRMEAIFSKYARFPTRDLKTNNSAGLGLSICREIMRLLNGEVTAANAPEGGALFTLSLPLR